MLKSSWSWWQRVRPATRRRLLAAVIALAALASGLSVLALRVDWLPLAAVGNGPGGAPPATQEDIGVIGYAALLARLQAEGHDVLLDNDLDGLPDVLENYLYGSDPRAFSTTGNGIPDGWFWRHGYDPTQPGIEHVPAAVPPPDALPALYGGGWPDRYRWNLSQAYAYGQPSDWSPSTFWDNGIDPRAWAATPDGIPVSWLVHYGLPTQDPQVGNRSLSGDGFTVRQNFEHDTDPTRSDTDGDGLTDREEIQVYGTDARRYSTSGSGVPDGWLVAQRLDPLDSAVGSLDPAGKGMTVAEVWAYNRERFGEPAALAGAGLAPTLLSHRRDGIPDGWLVAHGLDPLESGVAARVVRCASDYERVRNLVKGDTPEGHEPIPDLCLTVGDHYFHDRPASWSEALQGPWRGGLDPADGDGDGDGLPDAVELRGWFIQRAVDIGPTARIESLHVRSDPGRADTSGDGLTDLEEYLGEAARDGLVYRFPPTDPSAPDTALSGMTDAEKVFGVFEGRTWKLHVAMEGGGLRPLLDPTRRDSAGDYLPDGAAMAFWINASQALLDGQPYSSIYPGSKYESHLEWMNALPWLEGASLSVEQAAALLAPDGDVDNDGAPNVVDPVASGGNAPWGGSLLNGWKLSPDLLRFSDYPYRPDQPRTPTDPANWDTSGDGLPDEWKLRYGVWDSTLGGWDLDPAKWDSDGDGKGDADETLDADVVTWYAYSGDAADSRQWAFTNLDQFRAGTDPRLRDQNEDGLSEGWIYFWGRVYPAMAQRGDAGDRVPSPAELARWQGALSDPLDPQVARQVKDRVHYYRFAEIPVSTDGDARHLDKENRRESFVQGWPKDVRVLRESGGSVSETTRRIGMIEGVYAHTLAADSAWSLNPYMTDTSGDGIRDAWAVLYAPPCAAYGGGLHPVLHSAHDDPDQDGLTNFQEFDLGFAGLQILGTSELTKAGDFATEPCSPDTDLDGIRDGDDGDGPLLPGVGGSAVADADGDGMTDHQERRAGLDPRLTDTDRDGLLDGLTLPRPQQILDASAEDAFKAAGVAHTTDASRCQGGAHVCFFGEASLNADPRNPNSLLGAGLPDGWIAYHAASGAGDASALQESYRCSMPAWWDQKQFGVWWWGLDPRAQSACPPDRDQDGLHDRNGEDPVPGASQRNHGAATDLRALLRPDATADRLRVAQAWGECAGHPKPCFLGWDVTWFQTLQPRFLPVAVRDLHANVAASIGKEVPFNVSGRLVLCQTPDCSAAPSEPGIGNRTIVVRLVPAARIALPEFDPFAYDHLSEDLQDGLIVGVGFTDPTGRFNVSTCLCAADGTAEIPYKGITALGQSNGTATWTRNAAAVPGGTPWRVIVHAYASTPTYWGDPAHGASHNATHPQHLVLEGTEHATHRAWAADGVTRSITSRTVLGVSLPASLPWSNQHRVLNGTLQLRDASGGAVPHQDVALEYLHVATQTVLRNEVVRTGPTGAAAFELNMTQLLPQHRDLTGEVRLRASYAGSGAWSGAPLANATATLQSPLSIVSRIGDGPRRLGEPFSIEVTATSFGSPVSGLVVRASLGTVEVSASTNATGGARLTLTPSGMQPGPAQVRILTDQTAQHARSETTLPIMLVTGSRLAADLPSEARIGDTIRIAGRLTLADNRTPVAEATVRIQIGDRVVSNLTTRSDGRFDGLVRVPVDVPVGVQSIRAVYPGKESLVDAAAVEQPFVLVVGSRLHLEAAQAVRGDVAILEGMLTSAMGHRLTGEEVSLILPWNESRSVLVRGGGIFRTQVPVPLDHPIGRHVLIASYAGSFNGTFAPVSANVTFTITAPTRLLLDPVPILYRGNNSLAGQLLDAQTGAPIAGVTVDVATSVDAVASARTEHDGSYRATLEIPKRLAPGPVDLVVRFAGSERYSAAEARDEAVLRVPTSLVLVAPPELGRGTTQDVRVVLLDDRGEPVPRERVTLSLLGSSRNGTTDATGRASFKLDIAADAALGETNAVVTFEGADKYEPSRIERTLLVKDGVRIHVDSLPERLAPGAPVAVRIHVEDLSGRPVQTPLVVKVEGLPGVILAETNEEGMATAHFLLPHAQPASLDVTVRFPGTDTLASRAETLHANVVWVAPEPARPWLAWAALAAATLAAAGLAVLARRLVRKSPADAPMAILEDAHRAVVAGNPWAATVLLAYRRLSEHLGQHGLVEAESETSRGFAQTLVEARILDEPTAVQLVMLFEKARYASSTASSRDAEHAQRVLRQVIRRLGPHVEAGAAAGGDAA